MLAARRRRYIRKELGFSTRPGKPGGRHRFRALLFERSFAEISASRANGVDITIADYRVETTQPAIGFAPGRSRREHGVRSCLPVRPHRPDFPYRTHRPQICLRRFPAG